MDTILTQRHYDLIEQYYARQGTLNNVNPATISAGKTFAYTPEVERVWVNRLSAVDPFLSTIDMGFCTSQIVTDLGVDDASLISGRTKTSGTGAKDRETTSLYSLSEFKYFAVETTHDTHLTYDNIDNWAQEPTKFQGQITDKRTRSKANDLLKIGWNGLSVAENTDKVANPLGQDVNIGWLQRIRDNAPEQHIDGSEGTLVVDEISIGPTGADFKSLDALVNKMMTELIPKEHHRNLKVYVSMDLLGDRSQKLIEKSTVTEVGTIMTQAAFFIVNGLVAETPDYFPDGTVLVTASKNLLHRTQKQSVRASFRDRPERSLIANYNSANEFYAIGNHQGAALAENVVVKKV